MNKFLFSCHKSISHISTLWNIRGKTFEKHTENWLRYHKQPADVPKLITCGLASWKANEVVLMNRYRCNETTYPPYLWHLWHFDTLKFWCIEGIKYIYMVAFITMALGSVSWDTLNFSFALYSFLCADT